MVKRGRKPPHSAHQHQEKDKDAPTRSVSNNDDGEPSSCSGLELDIPREIKKLKVDVEKEGCTVLCIFREPFGGQYQLLVEVPVEKVKPTPYQRDLSEQHVRRLAEVIQSTGRFLDPIILVRPQPGLYWTPNGNHRREAMLRLGKEKIIGILLPDTSVAYQILALNTEKAHNIREKSLEVIRMYRSIMEVEPDKTEANYSFQFEEAPYITLGILYESDEKFSGASYHTFLKKIDTFLELPFRQAFEERKKRAEVLAKVDELVKNVILKIRERGINHPFLKQYVVSKGNPFGRKRKVGVDFYEAFERFKENLEKIDVSRVSLEEIASAEIEYSE